MVWWWRGQGLWMGLLVAACIASAGKALGPAGTAAGCVAAAVIVFILKNAINEASSLFSVPVRFWPPLLLVLAAVVYFGDKKGADRTDENMVRIAQEMNRKLPQENEFMRIEKVEYANRVMRYSGTLGDKQELDDEFKAKAQKKLQSAYCVGDAMRKANVSVEYSFTKAGMKNINDKLRVETWSTTLRPESCK